MEVVWSDLAIESLSGIFAYIQGNFGKRVASEAARKLIKFVGSIGDTPYLGRKIEPLLSYGEMRCAFYKQNHVYYLIIANRIEIILIWDGRQDPDQLRNHLAAFFNK